MYLINFTFLFIFFLGVNTSIYSQTCHPDDYASLLRLRDATNGGGGIGSWNTVTNIPNGANSRWIGTTVFNWHGIDTLHDINYPNYYRVRKINLNGNNFLGLTPNLLENAIPDSLFIGDGLFHVDSLILSNNNLNGIQGYLKTPIPTSSHKLEYLALDNNDLAHSNTNTFTYLLSYFGAIKKVRMNDAMGTASAPLSSYSLPISFSLEKIHLENNNFTGTLDLFTISNTTWEGLRYLYLDSNEFTDINITSTPVGSIFILSIENNKLQSFQGIANSLEFLDKLQELHASAAIDTSTITTPIFLNNSTFSSSLRIIDLSSNKLTGSLPIQLFEDIPSIVRLELTSNKLIGTLPSPKDSFSTGNFSGIYAYQGLPELKFLNLSNNNFQGALHLDWLFLKQIETYSSNGGLNIPLEVFRIKGNDFSEITPHLAKSHITQVLSAFNNRFADFVDIDVADNSFDFKDLFRLKRFFRFKQVQGIQDHYAPQSGTAPGNFRYSNQDSVGIGGVKRRTLGDSIVIEAGRNVIELEQGKVNVLKNKYTWERIGPLGTALHIGDVNPNGTFTAGPGVHSSYAGALGLLNDSTHKHKLAIYNLDTAHAFHHNRSFTACVSNDSFPLLTVCMKQKKLEVGSCTDLSGRPIECQTMIVQFHPDTLAQYNPAQQDSLKNASREAIGAKPIASCVCGDLELWEISDTASTMIEANGKGTKRTATAASGRPQLLSAEPNYSLLASNSSPLPDTVNLPTSSGNTTSTTLVAIIDSGLDYEYSSLVPYVSEGISTNTSCMQDAVWGYNFLDSTNNASDDHGHGTAIAGVVTGLSQQNLLPDTGNIAGSIGILPLKYTNKNGEGTIFNAACAMFYAADYERITSNGETAKVRVINNSWGYYGEPSSILEYTINYVGNACDILVINSAGNDGIQVNNADSLMHWPSNSIYDPSDTIDTDNILSVAAINNHHSNTLASYSNYDKTFIDLAAQGTDNTTQAGSLNGFVSVTGTSFATAQVSRAAALLFDKYPDATYFAVKYALLNGVDLLQSTDSLKLASGGRLNYPKADSLLGTLLDRAICSEYVSIDRINSNEKTTSWVQVYPNPVKDMLTIELDHRIEKYDAIMVRLFNIHGQLINSQQIGSGTHSSQLSTQDLPTGIYWIQLQVNGKQTTKKIIKQ